MRISCPYCGDRDRREFTYQGHVSFADRPAPDAGDETWDAYLHLRDNPAGATQDLWYHDPCGTWIVVERDTVSHAVHGSRALKDVKS